MYGADDNDEDDAIMVTITMTMTTTIMVVKMDTRMSAKMTITIWMALICMTTMTTMKTTAGG